MPDLRTSACLLGIALLSLTAAGAQDVTSTSSAAADRSSCVDDEVRHALRRDGRAVVFVNCRGVDGLAHGTGSSFEASDVKRVEAELAALDGAYLCRRFRSIPSLLYEISDSACLDRLESLDCVESVHLDAQGGGSLTESAEFVGANRVHAVGYRGAGAVVAVLDTGIDVQHPSFAGAILHTYHFLDQTMDAGPGADDDNGHGTNVAGIVASRGISAPVGVAPEAKLVIVKVLDSLNRGWISDWVAAVDHVISLHQQPGGVGVDVINMSFATDVLYSGTCDGVQVPFLAVCRRAVESGISLFAAAGNQGAADALPIPACYSSVVAVGSVSDVGRDKISSFTNRGTGLRLMAPGETIQSTGLDGGTSFFRGTSQAVPHVAGLACLLREINAYILPADIESLLAGTGRLAHDGVTRNTYRVVDGQAAAEAALLSRRFVRGECDAQGRLDITDPLYLLGFLFRRGPAPPCLEACNANSDGSLNIADALYSLTFLFGRGAPPLAPYPHCGDGGRHVRFRCDVGFCP